jgi:hypothetical protein
MAVIASDSELELVGPGRGGGHGHGPSRTRRCQCSVQAVPLLAQAAAASRAMNSSRFQYLAPSAACVRSIESPLRRSVHCRRPCINFPEPAYKAKAGLPMENDLDRDKGEACTGMVTARAGG